MLEKLVIKNVALIDSAEINFESGLNVLSGETGSGKSVIIESLNFVLGAKADKTLIRSGENECFVRAEFNVSNLNYLKEIFDELDLEYEELLVISRKFNLDGKNTIKVNGCAVTVSMLKKVTASLVDVHGQSEHFYLLKTANQLNLIDRFCDEKVSILKEKIAVIYKQLKDVINSINSLGGDESQRLMRLDVLNYQIAEIENCDLKNGEEEELLETKRKLIHQEKIATALNIIKSTISDENGVSDLLNNVARASSSISEFGSDFLELSERISSVYSEIDDISEQANSLIGDIDISDYNLDFIEDRLEFIKSLKKKYGNTVDDIFTYLENAKCERDNLENFNVIAENLLKNKEKLQKELYDLYIALSAERKTCANIFSKNVLSELKELGMSKADFSIEFNELPSINECEFNSANGIDQIEFKFSANLGEPLKPLSSVISGGEMSRFMLAIKTQTAKFNDISTFIFDEIDAGISGVVAKIVAEKFAKISKNVQIIAITHLPQISSMADNNLLIKKTETNDKTFTSVKQLTPDEKVNEITRLIGGEIGSETAIIHAKELIETATKFKKSL